MFYFKRSCLFSVQLKIILRTHSFLLHKFHCCAKTFIKFYCTFVLNFKTSFCIKALQMVVAMKKISSGIFIFKKRGQKMLFFIFKILFSFFLYNWWIPVCIIIMILPVKVKGSHKMILNWLYASDYWECVGTVYFYFDKLNVYVASHIFICTW